MANESHVHTFKRVGFTASRLASQMSPDVVLAIASQLPVSTTRIQLDADELVYADRQAELVAACVENGYVLLGTDLPDVTPRVIHQTVATSLATDFSVVPADDWKTIRSVSLVTRGNSALGIFGSVNGSQTLGVGGTALARLRVTGGPWSTGTSVRGADITAAPNVAFNHPLVVPPQGSDTTITVDLDVKVTVALSQLDVDALSSPETSGAALTVVEYV